MPPDCSSPWMCGHGFDPGHYFYIDDPSFGGDGIDPIAREANHRGPRTGHPHCHVCPPWLGKKWELAGGRSPTERLADLSHRAMISSLPETW